MKFKVGDRVAVYHSDKRHTGTVRYFERGLMRIALRKLHNGNDTLLVHPKQCRLLKKKEVRRIWVCEDYLSHDLLKPVNYLPVLREPFRHYSEFIEVKK